MVLDIGIAIKHRQQTHTGILSMLTQSKSVVFNGTCSQENVYRIAASFTLRVQSYLCRALTPAPAASTREH